MGQLIRRFVIFALLAMVFERLLRSHRGHPRHEGRRLYRQPHFHAD